MRPYACRSSTVSVGQNKGEEMIKGAFGSFHLQLLPSKKEKTCPCLHTPEHGHAYYAYEYLRVRTSVCVCVHIQLQSNFNGSNSFGTL